MWMGGTIPRVTGSHAPSAWATSVCVLKRDLVWSSMLASNPTGPALVRRWAWLFCVRAAALSARERDQRHFAGRDRLALRRRPGRGFVEILAHHVERGEFERQNRHRLDRHRHRPLAPGRGGPAEPT